MSQVFILISILMHFFSGITISWMFHALRSHEKQLIEKEERIIALNKDNSQLQEACRTPTAKARYRKLRRIEQ